MRSKFMIAVAALTFVAVGCEKRETNTTNETPSTIPASPGYGGGPSEDKIGSHDEPMMGGKDGGANADPEHGAESLSGGGAKTSKGATGESMAGGDAGK